MGGIVVFLVVREGEDIRFVAMLVGCLGTGTVGLGCQELDSLSEMLLGLGFVIEKEVVTQQGLP